LFCFVPSFTSLTSTLNPPDIYKYLSLALLTHNLTKPLLFYWTCEKYFPVVVREINLINSKPEKCPHYSNASSSSCYPAVFNKIRNLSTEKFSVPLQVHTGFLTVDVCTTRELLRSILIRNMRAPFYRTMLHTVESLGPYILSDLKFRLILLILHLTP
jgi:hypothetical protein